MKLKALEILHYVKDSYEGKPSFIFLMEDIETGEKSEWISNGCQFVENNVEDIRQLKAEFDCDDELDELLTAPSIDWSDLIDGSHAFLGCESLIEFGHQLPNLTNGSFMFQRTQLESWDVELPNLTDGTSMFQRTQLESWDVELPNLTDGTSMFQRTQLESWDVELPSLTRGSCMFFGTQLERWDVELPSLTDGTSMFEGTPYEESIK